MLKDRGTIKWTSLMLPEHVEMLKEMWQESEKINKPVIDPEEIIRMNAEIMQAYAQKAVICLSVYEDGHIRQYKGVVKGMDKIKRTLTFISEDDTLEFIFFSNIVSVTCNEGDV